MRNVGEMKEQIVILEKQFDDSSGTTKEELKPIALARAAVRRASGSEFVTSGSIYENVKAIFTIRAFRDKKIKSSMEISYKDRRYRIIEIVDNPVWHGFVDIRAESITAEGG